MLSAHLPVAPFINKIVLLALDIACRLHSRSSSSRSSSSAPSLLQADRTVVVDLRSTEVAFSSVLVATMSLASITVCGKRWSLLLSQAQCRHASKTFLTANEIRFLGNPAGYASSNCVHESLSVIASHVRGTWTPALQLDMMDFIKRIVAIVIIAKFSLFQRCFGHLKLPSRPASVTTSIRSKCYYRLFLVTAASRTSGIGCQDPERILQMGLRNSGTLSTRAFQIRVPFDNGRCRPCCLALVT